MCGDTDYEIKPRKGEYMMIDRNVGIELGKVIFMTPTEKGKGVLVTPTTDGNLMIGPNSYFIEDKDDTSTTAEGLEDVLLKSERAVPGIPRAKIINAFSGNRAALQSGDFVIGPSKANPSLIHVMGIDSPGLTCAPAIAEDVRRMIGESGIRLTPKTDAATGRSRVFHFRNATDDEINAKISTDPSFGKIVCRCENVSEGEVVDAIRRPAGARTMDGLKFRTRVGMGRCQGGFCSPRVMEILARELGIGMTEVLKNRKGSEILAGRTKRQDDNRI
jgi:glycerol-3-phosphate dehydrogenase